MSSLHSVVIFGSGWRGRLDEYRLSVGHCCCKPLPCDLAVQPPQPASKATHRQLMSAYFGAITPPQAPSSIPLLCAKYQPPCTTKKVAPVAPRHADNRQQIQAYAPAHYSSYFLSFSEQVFLCLTLISFIFFTVDLAKNKSWLIQTGFPRNCNTLQGVRCSGWLAHDHVWSACACAFCPICHSVINPNPRTPLPLHTHGLITRKPIM